MRTPKSRWKAPIPGLLLLLVASSAALIGKAPPTDKKSSAAASAQAAEYVGGDTCFTCHEMEEAFRKNPHYKTWEDTGLPWSERGCETCHGPGQAHSDAGGDVEQVFRFGEASARDISEKCLDCHLEQNESAGNFLRNEHGLNSVACTECHSVHNAAVRSPWLRARTPALCYDCHGEVRVEFNKPFRHRVHEGLIDCADCHNQHGGYNLRQLGSSSGNYEACFECHADKQGPFVFEHMPMRTDGCGSCHTPHGSSNPRMLKRADQYFLCMECHAGTVGVPGPAGPGFHNLTSIGWQNCTSCHAEVHGSNSHPVFFVD